MTLPTDASPEAPRDRTHRLPWARVASQVRTWAQAHGIAPRDLVVLLPFVQILAPARDAFAAAGVWMPRIETTRTLRATLGPAPAAQPGALGLAPAVDELSAIRLLDEHRGGFQARLDAARSAPDLVALAHGLSRVAAAQPPAARAEALARCRSLLAPRVGPGADERLLARLALEWAALAPAVMDPTLWSLRPAGWVVVRVGGGDPLAEALAAEAGAPTLTIDLDTLAAESLDTGRCDATLTLITCSAFEDEARAAAAEVIAMRRDAHAPVALIAQDRALTRRIRALLEQRGVAIADETGWRLSTTRAAARVTALLDVAFGDTATDTLLDAMKSLADWRPGHEFGRGAEWLEHHCRRRRLTRRSQLDVAGLEGNAAAALEAMDHWLAPLSALAEAGTPPVADWLDALALTLRRADAWDAMGADAAGRALIDALGLEPARGAGPALRAHPARLDASAFRHTIDRALETGSFVPPAPQPVDVVLLPLERALLRPFGGIVFPGADERQLGGPQGGWPWIGDRLAGELGLPNLAQRQHTQWAAMLHLLRVPQVVWLHRRLEAGESLGPSRWIERLEIALQRHGRAIERREDRRETILVPPTPVLPSEPVALRLPPLEKLSATGAESLRDCPYRFFALQRLRLAEARELDDDIAPNDFGDWAHEALRRFHAERRTPGDAASEVARLVEVAEEVRREQGLDEAAFVPFGAGFASLASHYIRWLHGRDAKGWAWREGEQPRESRPPALGGVLLHGVIDRIDAQGTHLDLIDYKTGSSSKLSEKLSNRFEDTQLAFYAALLGETSGTPVSARYLAVGKAQKLEELVHQEVAASAAALVQGLGSELGRIAAGAPLRPLGEGPSCDYCAARGLCRRDHWWQRP